MSDITIINSLKYIFTEKNINTFSKYNYDTYIIQSLIDHLNIKYNYSKKDILVLLYSFLDMRTNIIKKNKYYSDIYNTNYDDVNLRILMYFISTLKDNQII